MSDSSSTTVLRQGHSWGPQKPHFRGPPVQQISFRSLLLPPEVRTPPSLDLLHFMFWCHTLGMSHHLESEKPGLTSWHPHFLASVFEPLHLHLWAQAVLPVKNPPVNVRNVRDAGSIPESVRSPGRDA